MKYLIVSDIHGSLTRLEKILFFFTREKYNMLIILGDIINYGPRNGVPEGLDAMGIVKQLNKLSDKIVAVRGNCDSEVDQMLFDFPCMSDYNILVTDSRRIFLTHGHIYNEVKIPKLGVDALFYGHTHIWQLKKDSNGLLVCNTGSPTFPKGGNEATFATIEEDLSVNIRNLDGEILSTEKL